MRKWRALSVLFIMLSISSVSLFPVGGHSGGGEAALSGDTPDPRSPEQGRTQYILTPEDPSFIKTSRNLSSDRGLAFNIESNRLVAEHSLEASPWTGADLQGSRIIAAAGDDIFFAFTRGGASFGWFSFWILRYDSKADRWDDPIMVENFTGTRKGHPEITVHEGELFYLMPMTGSVNETNHLYATSTPISTYYYLANTTVVQLDLSGNVGQNMQSIVWNKKLVVFWSDQDSKGLKMVQWQSGSWSEPLNVLSGVSLFSILVYQGSSEKFVLLFHCPPNSDQLSLSFSTNGGGTWFNTMTLYSPSPGISSICSAMFEEDVYVSIAHGTEGWVRSFHSTNGENWSPFDYTIDIGTGQWDGKIDMQTAADRGLYIITVEVAEGVEVYSSPDHGETQERIATYGPMAHSPFTDPNKGWAGHFKDGGMEIYRFSPSYQGSLLTDSFSPMGLQSWDDIGIDIDGLTGGCSLMMRVLDDDASIQLYPPSGWIDVGGLGGGIIHGTGYNKVAEFSGGWSKGLDLRKGISLEFSMDRVDGCDPSIKRIALNYTTSFPFLEDMTMTDHIFRMVNCHREPGGIALDDGRFSGSVILGPVHREELWCDLITIKTSAISNRVAFSVELLGMDLSPIPGFDRNSSLVVTGISATETIRWDRLFLKDLQSTYQLIYVKVLLSSELVNGRPKLEELFFGYSTPPSIVNYQMDDDTLFRGRSTIIHLDLEDADEPFEFLDVEIEYLDPATGTWEDEMIKGQILDQGTWTVPVVTETWSSVGEYHLRAVITDSTGNTTAEDLDLSLTVLNNKPLPPRAYITPEVVTRGVPVMITIDMPGSDLETPEEELLYNYRFYRNGELHSEIKLTGNKSVLLPEDNLVRDDNWTINISTWDGMEESDQLTLGFIVGNNPPMKDLPPSNITLQEDGESGVVSLVRWFREIDGDDLAYTLEPGEGISINRTGSTFTVKGDPDYFGTTRLLATCSDGKVSSTIKVDVIVYGVNDPPVVGELPDVSVDQGETLFYPVSAKDDADSEDVTITMDIATKIPGIQSGRNYMITKNGSFYLIPNNEMVGTHTIQASFSDGITTVKRNFTIEVLNVNDAPGRPIISVIPEGRVHISGQEIILSVTAPDPDAVWGDVLTFSWTSDLDGSLGSGMQISPELSMGTHLITATVTDSAGATNSSTAIITVIAEPASTTDVIKTSTLLTYSAAGGLTAGLVLALIIFILVKRRKKEGDRTDGEGTKEDSEGGDKGPEEGGEKGSGEGSSDESSGEAPAKQENEGKGGEEKKEEEGVAK
ncbi:MAG: hypothetical protein ACMUIE_04695 [Thermoplasmatota archaeon]